MAGIANSWIEQYTVQQPAPCTIGETFGEAVESSTISSCLVWLIVGLFVGSMTKKKKGSQQ